MVQTDSKYELRFERKWIRCCRVRVMVTSRDRGGDCSAATHAHPPELSPTSYPATTASAPRPQLTEPCLEERRGVVARPQHDLCTKPRALFQARLLLDLHSAAVHHVIAPTLAIPPGYLWITPPPSLLVSMPILSPTPSVSFSSRRHFV
jgi:hypothetical protein